MFENLNRDIDRIRCDPTTPSILLFLKGILLDNGFLSVVMYRMAHCCFRKGIPFIPSILQRLDIFLTSVDISFKAEIGSGLRIAHGVGVVIGSNVKIGKNAIILQGVTVGEKSFVTDQAPVIGDNVLIGAGAKVLGDIRVGDNAKIGVNAVVVQSISAGSVVTCVPPVVHSDMSEFREGE